MLRLRLILVLSLTLVRDGCLVEIGRMVGGIRVVSIVTGARMVVILLRVSGRENASLGSCLLGTTRVPMGRRLYMILSGEVLVIREVNLEGYPGIRVITLRVRNMVIFRWRYVGRIQTLSLVRVIGVVNTTFIVSLTGTMRGNLLRIVIGLG